MLYHSELQLINTEHSMKACVQFTSRFLDSTLRSWAGIFVLGSVRVGIDV